MAAYLYSSKELKQLPKDFHTYAIVKQMVCWVKKSEVNTIQKWVETQQNRDNLANALSGVVEQNILNKLRQGGDTEIRLWARKMRRARAQQKDSVMCLARRNTRRTKRKATPNWEQTNNLNDTEARLLQMLRRAPHQKEGLLKFLRDEPTDSLKVLTRLHTENLKLRASLIALRKKQRVLLRKGPLTWAL